MFILYETINLKNDKKYVGVHETKTLDFDGYFGSGTALRHAVKKYGTDSFERVTLDTFEKKEDAYQAESSVVDGDFVKSRDTYNMKLGGFGGFDHIDRTKNRPPISKEHLRKLNEGRRNSINSEAHKEAIRKSNRERIYTEEQKEHLRNLRLGTKLTEEHKKKIGLAGLGRTYEIIECPFCKKTGKLNAMKGWHFDYCKVNPNRIERKKKKK